MTVKVSFDSDDFEINLICFMFIPGWNLTQTFPLLEDKVRHVEELSRRAPPAGANMTESIRNVKDVIEETRNLVNRVFFFFLNCCLMVYFKMQHSKKRIMEW